ncbi:MAG: ABC transporter permease [Cytophagales bacterium]|nr:ABC transporter permease [Cytophagales bacterium]
MLMHQLLLTYRTFLRFKGSFFINLIGLSTGLACMLLIFLWVHDELSMDKFHQNDQRLFQVMQHVPDGQDGLITIETTPGPLAGAMAQEIPEIEEVVSISNWGGSGILSLGDVRMKAGDLYVTPNFFNVFSFKLIRGDKDQVLKEKSSVVLSDALALKLFGTTENILGKTLEWERGDLSGPYTIAGVFEKPPRHNSAQFDLVFPFQAYYDKKTKDLQDWGSSDPRLYVLLQEGTDGQAFSDRIAGFLKTKYGAARGTANLRWVGTLFAQRYSDKYLYNHFEHGVQVGGRIGYVKLFSVIALFVLAIAAINFMNLSTAKASRRMKEVGIKKAIGATRRHLVFQFLSESVLLAFVALLLAAVLVLLLLPEFNRITGKSLALRLDYGVLLSVVAIAFFTGVLSGSYPALYLSRFKPVTVLKGHINPSTGEAWARTGLVVFQFALSVMLIASVLVVYQQIDYIQSKNLGYSKDNVVQIASEGKLRENQQAFLAEVKNMPGVVNASSMGGNLTGAHGGTFALEWEGKAPNAWVDFGILYVNYDLPEVLGMQLKEGRTFSRDYGAEDTKIIFNEAAVAAMGLKDPVGKTIREKGKEKQIIGVVKDFHFESLYQAVKPLFLTLSPNEGNMLVKIKAGTEKETMERIGAFYGKYNAGLPFVYKFLDQEYGALYAAENRVAVLSRYFAGIAILISCLGLFGLVAFTAERRRKEIGIRKVLGASEAGILYLLSGYFIKPVLVALLLALPVSYGVAGTWLKGFAYRIELEPWYFLLAGLLALGTALCTVGLQAFKAARTNPVQCLKEE